MAYFNELYSIFVVISTIGILKCSAKVILSPQGPIIIDIGEVVKINCSSDDKAHDLKWTFSRHQAKDARSSIRIKQEWVTNTTLQLSIDPVEHGDAGTYSCESNSYTPMLENNEKNIRLFVTKQSKGTTCNTNQWRCGEICIHLRYRCDAYPDCPDKSDEMNCDYSCDHGFKCDNGQCIDLKDKCDMYPHCRDGSDENQCGRQIYYTGQIVPSKSPDEETGLDDKHHQNPHGLHFNAVYSGVASVVGLVAIAAIIVVTVCRIHMRREAARHLILNGNQNSRGQRQRNINPQPRQQRRLRWQRSTGPNCQPPDVEDYTPIRTGVAYTPHPTIPQSLAVNINLQLTPQGITDLTNMMLPPPPYTSEVDGGDMAPPQVVPREGTPPPPYSTLDRHNMAQIQEEDEGESHENLVSETPLLSDRNSADVDQGNFGGDQSNVESPLLPPPSYDELSSPSTDMTEC